MTAAHPILAELARRRRARALSLGQVALRVRCHTSAVSWWEQGRHDPKLSNVEAYARALGLRLALIPAHDIEASRR